MEIKRMKETRKGNEKKTKSKIWRPNRNPQYEELDKILKKSPEVKRWTRPMRGKPITKVLVLRAWLWWMKSNEPELYALGLNGLIQYQKKRIRDNDDEFLIQDALYGWLYEKGGTYNTLRTYETTIRSFFMHNRAELTKDPTARIKPTRYSQISMFTVEEIRSIHSRASPMIRAVMLCQIMGGMGFEEILHWSNTGYNDLIEQLENKEPLIRVDLPGRKKVKGIKPYYTLLGRDAKKALREYLKEREKYVTKENSGYIFLTTRKNPLTYSSFYQTWMRVLRKLVLIPERQKGTYHRYGKNPHELRDFYRTRWEKSPATKSVGEFLMGARARAAGAVLYDIGFRKQGFRGFFMSRRVGAEIWGETLVTVSICRCNVFCG